MKILLTHGHIDALGTWEFERRGIPVFMSRMDDYVYREKYERFFP